MSRTTYQRVITIKWRYFIINVDLPPFVMLLYKGGLPKNKEILDTTNWTRIISMEGRRTTRFDLYFLTFMIDFIKSPTNK